MAHITETDYKKLAEAVADDLIHNKIALNESIQKLASSMQMSQEQVRRLCETANNTTFNKLFQSKDKTASDRVIEFDVADADKVLNSNIKEASVIEVDPVVYLDEYRSLADDAISEEPEITKVAFELRPEAQPRREVDRRTVQKTLDHLRHEKIATEYMYTDTLQSLKARFSRLYLDEPFTAFEKKAVAIHNDAAVKPLNDLRQRMKLAAVTYDIESLTKTAGFIDDSSLEYKLLSDAVNHAQKLAEFNAAISKLEALR